MMQRTNEANARRSRVLPLIVVLAASGACSSDPPAGDQGTAGVAAPIFGGSGLGGSGTGGLAGSTNVGTAGIVAGTGGGSSGTGGVTAGTSGTSGTGGAAGTVVTGLDNFSFFVTSYAAMQRLSNSVDGFGGDLRYGQADGLTGADKICTEIADFSMPGAGAKGWRAFLSVTKGPGGTAVHAIDRIGDGPWYDRVGRLLAPSKADLISDRPQNGDATIADDFPNEDGVPNHDADNDGSQEDNHDMLTGTNAQGQLYSTDWSVTCHDWTSGVGSDGKPRVGHSWPRGFGGGGGFGGVNGANWMSSLDEAGCAPGASLVEMGPPNPAIPTVGSGGGYGGIYCFALQP